jgi:hypothetical protein
MEAEIADHLWTVEEVVRLLLEAVQNTAWFGGTFE